MLCPRCGFDAQNMKFCPECGMQMTAPQPVNQQYAVPPVQNQNPYAAPVQNPVPNPNPYAAPVQNPVPNPNPYAAPVQNPVPNANPYAAPVQNQPRVVPVGQPSPHVTPLQSNARVTPMQSNARVVPQPPKSSNRGLLIAAIIIGAVVVSGIVIAVCSSLFYQKNMITAGQTETNANSHKIEYQLKD